VDRFKQFNDAYGHQQGDIALQMVAEILEKSVKRGVDFVSRYGGEEFVVLLPNTDLKGAMQVAEGIRKEIENTKKVTISIGVNTQIPKSEDEMENFIRRADKALYYAKRTGRNKVCEHHEILAIHPIFEAVKGEIFH
jgi:diguanylate cyclase (GGDEF)-like protein